MFLTDNGFSVFPNDCEFIFFMIANYWQNFLNEMSSTEARQNWARLIQKIYEVDPLICPKCQGQMKIISIIDIFEIIDKILRVTFRLKHLNLWDIRNHDPPEVEPVYLPELTYVEDSDYDNSGSQIPVFDDFWS